MQLDESIGQYIVGLRHMGVVCDDLDATLKRLQQLFAISDSDIVRIPANNEPCDTRFAFFEIAGLHYELIQPVSAEYIEKMAGTNRGANHVCYTVRDLPAAIAAMKKLGVRTGHVTADGMVETASFRMAYFHPQDTAGLLIEFVEDL